MNGEYALIKENPAIMGYTITVSEGGADRKYDVPDCNDIGELAKRGFIGTARLQNELDEKAKRRKADAMKALRRLYDRAEESAKDERALAQMCLDYVAVYEEIKG